MRALLLRPDPRGVRTGNRLTALRWAALWRGLGVAVRVRARDDGEPADRVVALHAVKSAAPFLGALAARPGVASVLVLGGTEGIDEDGRPAQWPAEARAALDAAQQLVVLQPRQRDGLPTEHAARATVVLPSARAIGPRSAAPERRAEVAALGHLRPVKDPFLLPRALSLLPRERRLTGVHVGAGLDDAARARAERESEASARWRWLGERPRRAALARLLEGWALVMSSRSEGASGALVEALVHGVPAIASAIGANAALLGDDWPALFPVGDAQALATLLERLECDVSWREELDRRAAALAPRFAPEREREDWRRVLFAAP